MTAAEMLAAAERLEERAKSQLHMAGLIAARTKDAAQLEQRATDGMLAAWVLRAVANNETMLAELEAEDAN